MKECYQTQQRLNPLPPDHQSDTHPIEPPRLALVNGALPSEHIFVPLAQGSPSDFRDVQRMDNGGQTKLSTAHPEPEPDPELS